MYVYCGEIACFKSTNSSWKIVQYMQCKDVKDWIAVLNAGANIIQQQLQTTLKRAKITKDFCHVDLLEKSSKIELIQRRFCILQDTTQNKHIKLIWFITFNWLCISSIKVGIY